METCKYSNEHQLMQVMRIIEWFVLSIIYSIGVCNNRMNHSIVIIGMNAHELRRVRMFGYTLFSEFLYNQLNRQSSETV
jgi:hypothetical protein